jgi:hypothetical protein
MGRKVIVMGKISTLFAIGATGAALYVAGPIGSNAALAGPIGPAAPSTVALPAPTEPVVHRSTYQGRTIYRSGRYGLHRGALWHGRTVYGARHYGYAPHRGWRRSAFYGGRSAYLGRPAFYAWEGRLAYRTPSRVIIERRTAYVAPAAAAAPVIYKAVVYPDGGQSQGLLGGLFGGLFGGLGL